MGAGAGAGAAGRGAGCASPEIALPQFMQNFASGGATVPHDGQTASSAFPHDMQKRASAGFSVPQF